MTRPFNACFRLSLLCVAATAAACAAGTDTSATNVVAEPPWHELSVVWQFASNDSSPRTSLTDANGGTLLPDGRLVVTEMKDGFFRVFDTAGKLLEVVGRKGEGPGEFDNAMGAMVIGDTLVVVDWTQVMENELYDMNLRHIGRVLGFEGGGYGMVRGGMTLSDEDAYNRTSVAKLALFDNLGQKIKTITADTATRVVRHKFRLPGKRDSLPSPIVAHWSVGVLPGRAQAVVLSPGDLWTGTPGEVTMRRVHFPEGTVSEPLVFRLPPRAVTSEHRDTLMALATAPMDAGQAAQYLESVRLPDYYPAFRQLFVGEDSTLWLREFLNDTTFLVVSLEGRALARVHTPRDFRPYALSMTDLWGRILDEDRVPTIVRYRVERPK